MVAPIIGGMFGLETGESASPAGRRRSLTCLAEPHLLLATGRSAFTLLARTLRPPTVWLPSYLCGVVMGAFPAHLQRVRFYAVDERLEIADADWLEEIQAGDMVVFIDYFGFNQWSASGAEARRRGAWVVEDACQALLNERFCAHSHYVVFSPRKFVGVPDGGILLAQGDAPLPEQNLPPPPAEWWLEAFKASRLRHEFDQYGGDRRWFELFRKTGAEAPVEPCRMGELSRLILGHVIDFDEVARRRRENFRQLAAALPELALFRELPAEVVPLGFPIRLAARDQVRQALFEARIYPPTHWPLGGVIPQTFAASHALAAHILTLPCDQRYGRDDMERMVSVVSSEIARDHRGEPLYSR
jgi:hypothetical protein